MENKNKDTINKFEEAKHILKKAQKEEENRQLTLGRTIEEIDLTKKLLEDLIEQGRITPEMSNSGEVLSDTLYEESFKLLERIEDPEIGNLLRYVESVSGTASITIISRSSMLPSTQDLPHSYFQLRNFKEQKSNQEEIIKQLKSKGLNSIATEYKNAWDLFFSSSEDRTRGSMALMRGVIDKLYYHFAPTEQVKNFLESKPDLVTKIKNKHITKRQRIQYIASELIRDENKRKVFIDAEDGFTEICDKLSKYKKHGPLDEERTKNVLFEADSLIKLLLVSIL